MNVYSAQQIQIRTLSQKDFDQLTDPNGPWGFAKIKRSYLEWFTQYRRDRNIMLVACLEDQIVGYFWNYAVMLKVQNEVIDAFGGTLFTHPEHRKKNCGNLLSRKAIVEFQKRESIHYGFPVNMLVPYFQKVGAHKYFGTIPRSLRILNAAYIIEEVVGNKKFARFLNFFCRPLVHLLFLEFRSKPPKDVAIKEVHFFDEHFDRLWEQASPKFEIAVTRNREYLNWACHEESKIKPVVFTAEKEGELVGYIIVERMNPDSRHRGGVIVDLFDVQDPRVTKALIQKAVAYFKEKKMHKIEFYILNPYYQSILKSMGFREIQSKKDLTQPTHFLAGSYTSKIDPDYFYNREHWFITKLDTLFT